MAPPPPRPATSDGTKRHGGAPQQLAKLDLAVERQKSAKLVGEKGLPVTKQKPTPGEPQDDGAGSGSNQTAAKKKKPAATTNPTPKTSKTVKVAVASDDQFNDIGEITKAGAKDKATSSTKPRPASAGIVPAKPQSLARPASAGGVSPLKKAEKQGSGVKKGLITSGNSKLAFADTKILEDSHTDDHEERSLGCKEPEAKGLYDIFVQTRRCEKLCYEVGLKLKHIRKMKKKFDDNDMYHTGEITQAEFYFIINEERRPLTKGILQYGNVSPDQKFMSFDEFLLCVVSFAVLTPPEVYQYAFDLYDADQSGTLDEYEFAKMSKEMQSKQFSFPKNTAMAIKMIEGKDSNGKRGSGGGGYVSEDGLVDLSEFMKFAKLFPVAFFPLFNFQKNVRRSTLGESKWSQLAARKLKIQELVSHMRRNYGAIPELSLGERLWSIVDDEVLAIRKRASEIYGQELNQRRKIGDDNGDPDIT